MSYLPLQIIVTVFVILVVFRLTKKFKDNVLKTSEFIGWLAIWLAAVVVFWLPQTTSYLAAFLGIGRGVDLAVYLAILLLFNLIFRLYLKIDKQQNEITKLVRHLALEEKERIKNEE
ncbi:MAG: hypothetical protein UV78_C0011G0003 [Parcubacteria group bacterium GW2011_GWA2_43_17]|nr:MAG: hypothetical protein UV78_C0011G0003 [Parcubacteria group bacterium GW2011_GWA2_43_17]KKT90529.1 MAG: hypothetical protein UW91_C0057G0005 [Parcubacteria group bacterium GW2011_GWF2_45_11]KKT96949.1 MAG: hypothetical protein UW98_C0029G0005 [Parcubacteria group bacterium GW2011_GWC2_45_15]HAH04098.1 hypothetical protein [Candidatus Komeilibacteria bacterium]HBR13377.1 hypothetical protein [Candidatus Komeilibacteria bacterium]